MSTYKDNVKKRKEKNLMDWVAYYRQNPHKFAKEHLGISLFPFQEVLVYAMAKYNYFTYIASRSQGKSWLIAVFCIIRCILYPGTEVVIASGTKGQAKLIITEKIASFMRDYPIINAEIDKFDIGVNTIKVKFKNGSQIVPVVSNDNTRGFRAHLLIMDEFRLVSKDVKDGILVPLKLTPRQPLYLRKKEYAHLREENKEIYLSSAWYKSHWIWGHVQSYCSSMLKNNKRFLACLPFQLNIKHGLMTEDGLENIVDDEDFDRTGFKMEYGAEFIGENNRAFFKMDSIQKCRTLEKAFIPPTNEEWHGMKKTGKYKHQFLKKKKNETRIIGVDVAMMGSNKYRKNDTTVFTCLRMFPDRGTYRRDLVHMERMEGQHSEKQAIRLKQLFNDFDADYIVMDTMGNGISLYDQCAGFLYDVDRDIEYQPYMAMNDEEMAKRLLGNEEDALPCIFSIKASAEINHKVANGLRIALENQKIKLLINDIEAKANYVGDGSFSRISMDEEARLLRAFRQTTGLQNELVNLEYQTNPTSGWIKIHEVGNATKDRYSSLGYANYFADLLEKDLIEGEKEEVDLSKYVIFV